MLGRSVVPALSMVVSLVAACTPEGPLGTLEGPAGPRCEGPVDRGLCQLPERSAWACGDGILEPGESCDPGGAGACGPDCRFTSPGCVELPDGPVAVVCDDEAAFLERVEELDRVTFDDRPAGILERREYLAPGIRIYVETNELEIYRYGEDGEVVSTPNFLANAWDFGWGGSGIYGYVDGPFYFVPTAPVRAFGAYAWTADGGLEYWAYDGAPPNMPPGDRILAGAISVPRSSEEVPYLGLILRCDVGSFVIMEPDAPSLCCGVGIDDVLLACPAP